jgi:hypothetical protein
MFHRRLGVLGALSFILVTVAASSAWAQATTVCLPQAASKPILSVSSKGECPTKGKVAYKAIAVPEPAELEAFSKISAHINYVESGIGGKPTVQFTGVNVQVVNGEGKTATENGEGNLVIGYDEEPGQQSGSHNLALGERQEFTSDGSILGGEGNKALDSGTTVLGMDNLAEGVDDSVLGGSGNSSAGLLDSITGGERNNTSGVANSVSGGIENNARGEEGYAGESISGGEKNKTACRAASVSGGIEDSALGDDSWAGGGQGNRSGACANGHGAVTEYDRTVVSGGYHNDANAEVSSVFGGKEQETTEEFQAKL